MKQKSSLFILLITFLMSTTALFGQLTNGMSALTVLGQPDFVSKVAGTSENQLNGPNGVAVDTASGKLFVIDRNNNRILRWSSADALSNNSNAEAVFGQSDFTSNSSGTTASKFNNPIGVHIDSEGRMWVGDFSNNRVLRFDNASSITSGADADAVLGQPDFVTNTSGTSVNTFAGPVGISVDDNGNLWVSEFSNNRVTMFANAASKINGDNADLVLGQPDFTTNTSGTSVSLLKQPNGVYADALGNLWVSDYGNKRFLKFSNAASKSSGADADGVLGQPDFTSNTGAITINGSGFTRFIWGDDSGRIYCVQESNNRILVYEDGASKSKGANSDFVIGQQDFESNAALNPPTDASLNIPRAITADNVNEFIWVADYLNNRVLRFDVDNTVVTKSLTLISPNGGEDWLIGTTQNITWNSNNITTVRLEYSVDNGVNWELISTETAANETYAWAFPDINSDSVIVKISDNDDNTIFDISNNRFRIGELEVSIKLLSPNGGEYWTTGSTPRISWEGKNVKIVTIDLSYDDGATWEKIVPFTIAVPSVYTKWKIPDITSDNCRLKISKFDSLEIFSVSEEVFRIVKDDSTNENIVVLGSSTAAGTGPDDPDSAWVNRYRNHIYEKNTTVSVINLAVGGYTTYELMHDGFIPPVGRPSPSIGHNITEAIAFNPRAIIINLPSNDATNGFSVEDQIANYDSMLVRSNAANIPVWISTTQPRNLSLDKIQIQMDMRDSTYSHFGNYAVDFWTDIANEDGTINFAYNSGDGVHLNNAGHKILFDRVVEKAIYEQTILPTSIDDIVVEIPTEFVLEQNYPNPFNPTTKIQFSLPSEADVNLRVFDILGREVSTLINERMSAGNHSTEWNAVNVSAGTYFYMLSVGNQIETKKMLLLK